MSDGTVIDLDARRLRLTKRHGAIVEGVLIEAPSYTSGFGQLATVHLRFAEDITATWIPGAGEMLENVR
jgi:hypothetical protein